MTESKSLDLSKQVDLAALAPVNPPATGTVPASLKAQSPEAETTVQSRPTQPVSEGGTAGLGLMWMAYTGGLVARWWSTRRDKDLRRKWRENDLFSGAVYNISSKLAGIEVIVEPRDPSIRQQRALAERYSQRLIERSEFGRGWHEFFPRWLLDLWTQDNGAFGEIIGDGPLDGPIKGPALGLANLDAACCTRTGNAEFPVVYRDPDGSRYKLHYTRVIFASQLPDNAATAKGVGFCWFSRALGFSQHLTDILTYLQEKLGSRPLRGVFVGKGIDPDIVTEAVSLANESADNAGLQRLAKYPVIGDAVRTDIGLDLVDLASLPDGFDFTAHTTLGMYAIALTGGFPARWLWPATATGATKADAMLQHTAGAMSGAAYTLNQFAQLLGGPERGARHETGKFLPSSLRMRFDIQDDELDRMRAENQLQRSERRERDLAGGSITLRVAREQMLGDGDLTQEQFDQLELQDGRTPDGLPVAALFYSDNPYLAGLDARRPSSQEIESRLQEAMQAATSEGVASRRKHAEQAIYALGWFLDRQRDQEQMQAQAEQERDLAAQAADETVEDDEDDNEAEAETGQEPASPAGRRVGGLKQAGASDRVLYVDPDGDFQITEADVDRAIEIGRRRVGPEFAALLTAEPVD